VVEYYRDWSNRRGGYWSVCCWVDDAGDGEGVDVDADASQREQSTALLDWEAAVLGLVGIECSTPAAAELASPGLRTKYNNTIS